MNRLLVSAVAAVALGAAALVAVTPATAGAATDQCRYTPVLPAKISVGQSVVGLRVPIRVTSAPGANCAANFLASESLVRGSDSFFLLWDDTSTTDVESVYAFEISPGTYRTASDGDCYAFSADYETNTCSVGAAATVIKFAGHARLTGKRLTGSNRNKVSFTVRASRYADYQPVYLNDAVSIQRYSAGRWHTIHTGAASASKGYTWTYTMATRARYRAVSAETPSAFGGTSASLTD